MFEFTIDTNWRELSYNKMIDFITKYCNIFKMNIKDMRFKEKDYLSDRIVVDCIFYNDVTVNFEGFCGDDKAKWMVITVKVNGDKEFFDEVYEVTNKIVAEINKETNEEE